MNKKVIIRLCEDNTVELYCDDTTRKVSNNSLSALAIYELLNYQNGDIYTIETDIKGKKKEIIEPIKTLLDNIKNQIDALPSVSSQVEDDLKKLEESNDNELNI